MSDNRTRVSVQSLIDAGHLYVNDGYRAKNSELSTEGIPFARIANVNDGFHFQNADRFPVEDLHKVGAKISEPGDVVFTSKGTVGRFAFVQQDSPPFVYSPQLCFWRALNRDLIHPRWLFYWMQGREFLLQYRGVAGQTDMAEYVSLGDQRLMSVTIPTMSQQEAIAHILGTLDDKIDLNRQVNRTLEATARAIFKLWFVDFEPIPGIGPHKEWEDSPLGRIPKGWRNGTWADLITLEYGKSLKGNHVGEGPYPVYGTNGRIGSCHAPLCEHPEIIIGRKGAYRGVHYSSSPFFVIDTAFYVKPRAPLEMRWAFYEMIRLDINGMDSGSAIPSTSREDFYRLPVMIPPYEVQWQFVQLATPLWLRQEHNYQESLTLASIRDTLLPKLLSG